MLIADSYLGTLRTDLRDDGGSSDKPQGFQLAPLAQEANFYNPAPAAPRGRYTEDKSMDNKHTGISDPNLHTFTGIPAGEIPARLAVPFDDPRAYKGVPGGVDLTDISTGHMLERITQVFGPKGLGWNFLFDKEDVEIGSPVDKRVLVRLKYALFQYILFGAEGQPQVFEIVTSGSNTNSLEYAEEGARTSALGAAIKGLCFQLPVYKGLLDHHNVEQYLAGGATKQPSGGSETSTGNGKVRSAAAKAGPAAAEAAEPEPAPQLAAQPGNGGSVHPGEFVINVGTKYRGKKVRELAENVLAWFANLEGKGFAPQSPDGQAAQAAVRRYLDLQAEPA